MATSHVAPPQKKNSLDLWFSSLVKIRSNMWSGPVPLSKAEISKKLSEFYDLFPHLFFRFHLGGLILDRGHAVLLPAARIRVLFERKRKSAALAHGVQPQQLREQREQQQFGQHPAVPHGFHPGADRQAGEGVCQGELHQQAQEVRARRGAQSAGEYHQGEGTLLPK